MWFTIEQSAWIGSIAGASVGIAGGILGSVAGLAVPRGIGRRFFLTLSWVLCLLGAGVLGVGLFALTQSQPYHVWYPFVLIGSIMMLSFGIGWITLRTAYRSVELRKMAALDRLKALGVQQVDSFDR